MPKPGGLPPTRYGLDVNFDLEVPRPRVEELVLLDTQRHSWRARCSPGQLQRAEDPDAEAMTTLGDYGVVAIVDRRPYRDGEPPDRGLSGEPIDITVEVDGQRYVDPWLSTISTAGRP